jgi:zinc protease
VKRASETNIVGIAHKIPEATHADVPALTLLALILSDGKTSRLHRALVDTAKALDVSASCNQFHDPSLFITYVTLAPRVKHADIEKQVKRIYADIAEKGVTTSELTRAKQSMRAYLASRRDGAYQILSSLNEEIAAGDWTRFATFPEALMKTTAPEVRRVARTYFNDDVSTIGYFIGTV